MSNLLRERMSHPDEARSLLRAIYNTEGDILPEPEAGTLTIRLHQLANHMSSESIRYLIVMNLIQQKQYFRAQICAWFTN